MINFCTLFDQNYLSKGIILYRSLEHTGTDFHLFVLDMDGKVAPILRKMNLARLTVLNLNDFEDEKLLSVKTDRSPVEYCWTCTPSLILYCIRNFALDICIYLDADLYFYSDPIALINEVITADKEVLITEHRFSNKRKKMLKNGRYCVQFMLFMNRPASMKVLKDWRDDCLCWCFDRLENGKFGDQKYLDDWLIRYDCVHELNHLGGGIAPWNIQQFKIIKENGITYVLEKSTALKYILIFYHFHGLRFYDNGYVDLSEYRLQDGALSIIYLPYIKQLTEISKMIKSIVPSCNPLGIRLSPEGGLFFWKKIKRILKRTNNYLSLDALF